MKSITISTLAFAFLLLTTKAYSAEQDSIPELPLSAAASIAEKELKKLDSSGKHYIKLVFYAAAQKRYSASIAPALPADSNDPEGKKLAMFIYMDGRVQTYETTVTDRRIIRPQPNAEQGAAANP